MSEPLTERESALLARVAALEEAAARRADAPRGNIVEQLWRYFSAFVPPSILAAGLAVFVGFHAFTYYNDAQLTAAETRVKLAQRALKDVEASAQNAEVGGLPLRVQSAKAEVEKKRAEAARARTEANALTTEINGAELRVQTMRATVAKKQAEAIQARQAADAATTRYGVRTLNERAAFAKLVTTQLTAAEQRFSAVGSRMLSESQSENYAHALEAMCAGSMLAKYLSCPSDYVAMAPQSASPPEAATPSDNASPRVGVVTGAPELVLRNCPKRSCDDMGHMREGWHVRVLGDASDGWLQISVRRSDGSYISGFVNGKFISIN